MKSMRRSTVVVASLAAALIALECLPGRAVAEQASMAQQLLDQADADFQRGAIDQAMEIYKLASSAAEKEMVAGVQAEALAQVARCYLKKSQAEEGRAWLRQAAEVANDQMPRAWSRYLGVRGRFEWQDDQLSKATETFLEMYDYSVMHELHERAVDAAHMVAITAPPEEQILWAQKGIAAAEEGGLEGWLGPLWNNLGWTYDDLGRYQESLDALRRAREYHWKLGTEMNKLIADWSVGHAYRMAGKFDQAQAWMRPVLAWSERLSADDPDSEAPEWVGQAHRELGELSIARGDLQEGLDHLRLAQQKLAQAGMPEWDEAGYGQLTDRLAEIAGQAPGQRIWHGVIHFEIPFDDASRATAFYRELFGWEIAADPEMEYWLVNTVPTDERGYPTQPGINGGMMKRVTPEHRVINYISVESVDEYLQKAVSLGGQIVVPKTAIPGMGWFANLSDTEGNVIGIIEDDPGAGK